MKTQPSRAFDQISRSAVVTPPLRGIGLTRSGYRDIVPPSHLFISNLCPIPPDGVPMLLVRLRQIGGCHAHSFGWACLAKHGHAKPSPWNPTHYFSIDGALRCGANSPLRASCREAASGGRVLGVLVGLLLLTCPQTQPVQAQQGLPFPPAFKDLTAAGVIASPVPQTANPSATQTTGGDASDPFHVLSNPSPLTNPNPTNPSPGQTSASEGRPRVLVLKSGRVLQGSIHSDSRGYFVDAGQSSTYFPFDIVRFVAPDLAAAHRMMSDSISDRSARRDMLLGRWCMENGLKREAADHFRTVLVADRSNREARECLNRLAQEEAATMPQRGGGSGRGGDAAYPESLARLPRSSVREFVLGIQPMLLARCGSARCHGTADPSLTASSFRLENVRLSQGSNRAATARNLEAVLGMIDGQFPTQSPLFERGLAAHGGLASRSPLDGPSGRAQEARLRRWVESVAPEMNRLNRQEASRKFVSRFAKSGAAALKDPNVVPASAEEEERQERPERTTGGPAGLRPVLGTAALDRASQRDLGPLTDPFDPAQFNSPQAYSPQFGSPQLNAPQLGTPPQINQPQLNAQRLSFPRVDS